MLVDFEPLAITLEKKLCHHSTCVLTENVLKINIIILTSVSQRKNGEEKDNQGAEHLCNLFARQTSYHPILYCILILIHRSGREMLCVTQKPRVRSKQFGVENIARETELNSVNNFFLLFYNNCIFWLTWSGYRGCVSISAWNNNFSASKKECDRCIENKLSFLVQRRE